MRAVVLCDWAGCHAEYVGGGTVRLARRMAARAGWAVGLRSMRDSRRVLDYCAEHAGTEPASRLLKLRRDG